MTLWSFEQSAASTQSPEVENPGAGRACVRVHGKLDEPDFFTNHRHEAGEMRDRILYDAAVARFNMLSK